MIAFVGGIMVIAEFFGITEQVSQLARAHIDIFVIVTMFVIILRWMFVDIANYNRKKTFTKRRRTKAGAGAKGGPRK